MKELGKHFNRRHFLSYLFITRDIKDNNLDPIQKIDHQKNLFSLASKCFHPDAPMNRLEWDLFALSA